MAKLLGGTTVYGLLSATGVVYASGGNSDRWNTAYNIGTIYQNVSSSFATNTTVSAVSSLTIQSIPIIIPIATSSSNVTGTVGASAYFNSVGAGYASGDPKDRQKIHLMNGVIKKVSLILNSAQSSVSGSGGSLYYRNITTGTNTLLFSGLSTVADGNFANPLITNTDIPITENSLYTLFFSGFSPAQPTTLRTIVDLYVYAT